MVGELGDRHDLDDATLKWLNRGHGPVASGIDERGLSRSLDKPTAATSYRGSYLRSLTEFATTETEENAMAAAAIIGLRNPRAASGMAAVL